VLFLFEIDVPTRRFHALFQAFLAKKAHETCVVQLRTGVNGCQFSGYAK
jgi:hypothetical protein